MAIFNSYVKLPEGKTILISKLNPHFFAQRATADEPSPVSGESRGERCEATVLRFESPTSEALEPKGHSAGAAVPGFSIAQKTMEHQHLIYPDAPCMVYLPTFGSFMG
jgi:hypothetical protein